MFAVRGRAAWGAKKARSAALQTPASIHTLVVHHTAGAAPKTRLASQEEMRSIQRYHMDTLGWSDIGYNFVIDPQGVVWEGRGYYRIGAHTQGCNTGTIGVSFMGNYETRKLSLRQRIAFRNLKRRLAAKGIKPRAIKGHRDMPNQSTACPGKNIMSQLGL